MYFSKSKYTQGIQCPKMLWMRDNMPEYFDQAVLNQAVLDTGSEVGDLAMGYFGPYVEVPFDAKDPNRFQKAASETQHLLESGERVICEATFSLPGHYCMVDILRVREDGSFDVVEVKSATSVHDIYYQDLAYQCWLLEECGYRINTASLMHINSGYSRNGELDLQGLFTLEDLTEDVRRYILSVPNRLEAIAAVADEESEPTTPIGLQCFKPYPCGYHSWCFKHLPEPNVFDLNRISKKKALALTERGSAGFNELSSDVEAFETLSEKQQMQILCELNDAPVVDKQGIAEFLSTLSYPLYFLDFETFQEAIPSFNDEMPYEQVTSQYSLHWIDRAAGPLNHEEFLGEAGKDPRRSVAEHLCRDIPEDVCVLAWNMGFEKGCIGRLAELFPDLSSHLMAIHGNIRDLMAPFSSRLYYTKEMSGSSSIKMVLPALFPDEPELDYHALEGVHNGAEAASAFQHLADLPEEEQARVREQLLRYCELDTLAMVRIWERLTAVVAW